MTAPPESKPSPAWLFWLLASACIWGYFVPLGIKKFIGYDVWVAFFGYTVICWVAAFFLARAKRTGATTLAVLHVVAGVAWLFVVAWMLWALAKSRGLK